MVISTKVEELKKDIWQGGSLSQPVIKGSRLFSPTVISLCDWPVTKLYQLATDGMVLGKGNLFLD